MMVVDCGVLSVVLLTKKEPTVKQYTHRSHRIALLVLFSFSLQHGVNE